MATDSRKPEQTVQEQVKSQSLSHYVLQAFVINCFIFAVVLLGFTIWQYHYLVKKETAIQKASIQLEDQHKCIKCCASHDFYKNCDDCFDSLPICKNKAKNRNKSHYTIDGIKKIVEDDLESLSGKRVLERLSNETTFHETMKKLKQVHKNTFRPAAHLTHRDHHGHQRRHTSGSWQYVRGGGSTFAQGKLAYYHQKDVLKISKDGSYNIHVQTTFRGTIKRLPREATISHKVLLRHHTAGNKKLLMENTKQLSSENCQTSCFHTLSSSSVQRLSAKDELEVHIIKPDDMRIATDGSKTYFDVVMT